MLKSFPAVQVGAASPSPESILGLSSYSYLRMPADSHFSYDYGSSIRETRALTDKFDEVKRQGLFLRSSPQLLKTDWMGNSSLGIPGVTLNGSSAFVTSLKNPDSGTWFHITRQSDSSST